ncbi:MAG: type II toxin-antitoxin system VapC family toxin [Actinomycetota bacterium]|nr:type II toxin-antitoxin system VapC family toxin [Actinomycetota bacterium]
MIVVDASVLANVVGDDAEDGRAARDRIGDAGDVAMPDLGDVETVAVLRRRWLAGDLTDERFAQGVAVLVAMPIERFPVAPFMPRAFELRANVIAYDATYVALAEELGCSLVTGDGRLAAAPGVRCHVEVLNAG